MFSHSNAKLVCILIIDISICRNLFQLGTFKITIDLHLSKALFSLYPDNLQVHCFLGVGALSCCSFFCSLDQPSKTLQTVEVAHKIFVNQKGKSLKCKSHKTDASEFKEEIHTSLNTLFFPTIVKMKSGIV